MSEYGKTFEAWRNAAGSTWSDYTRHAFVEGLGNGSLPRAAFLNYLVQDYVFLFHFSRAWALLAAKADTPEEMRIAASTIDGLVNHEMAHHIQTCAAAGIDEAALFSAQEEPENLAYTRYVLEAGYSGDFLDLLAALAPCVMGYGEIGARLSREATSTEYKDWIATYASDEYQKVCVDVGALIDAAVARRIGTLDNSPRAEKLAGRFETASRLEAAFWSMGLRA